MPKASCYLISNSCSHFCPMFLHGNHINIDKSEIDAPVLIRPTLHAFHHYHHPHHHHRYHMVLPDHMVHCPDYPDHESAKGFRYTNRCVDSETKRKEWQMENMWQCTNDDSCISQHCTLLYCYVIDNIQK